MVDLNRDGCGRYEVHRKRKLWQGLSCYAASFNGIELAVRYRRIL